VLLAAHAITGLPLQFVEVMPATAQLLNWKLFFRSLDRCRGSEYSLQGSFHTCFWYNQAALKSHPRFSHSLKDGASQAPMSSDAPRPRNHRDAYIAAMWLMFLRAPAQKTGPGEPVDLGEIGEVRQKDWERLTPYSVAGPR